MLSVRFQPQRKFSYLARYSTSATTDQQSQCIGIVKEVYSKWERRAPFTPDHVRHLVRNEGIQVLVEPSLKRVFTDAEYEAAGAVLTSDLSPASAIFGVKQVPEDKLLADKTYVFFSHTIKGQKENMGLLDEILRKNIRLVDYECITVDGKRSSPRLVAFGGHAGRAGMIDAFRGLGERLLDYGVSNPFLNVGSSYMYRSYDEACNSVAQAGQSIANGALEGVMKEKDTASLMPLTFTFTGSGNVSQGAQEVFKLLPHEMVSPSDLPAIVAGDFDPRKVYGCVATEKYIAESKSNPGTFQRNEYYENPGSYRPTFHELVAPYTSVLVNGMYWDARYPRLLTSSQLSELHAANRERMLLVADVTCDIGGSVEFLHRSTPIESPFFNVSKETGNEIWPENDQELEPKDTLMMLGVDILPSELAKEATSHFGDCMVPLVKKLVQSDSNAKFEDLQGSLPAELVGAIIATRGELAPAFRYIEKMRNQRGHGTVQLSAEDRALEGSTVLQCKGHMFDTGLINLILDTIEESQGRFAVLETIVGPNPGAHLALTSSIMIQVTVDEGRDALEQLIERIKNVADSVPESSANITELEDYCSGNFGATLHRVSSAHIGDITEKRMTYRRVHAKDNASMSFGDIDVGAPKTNLGLHTTKRVTLLGAGMVAGPAVEMLSRDRSCHVIVVSAVPGEAQRLLDSSVPGRNNVEAVVHDVGADLDGLTNTIAGSDTVISLLPQTMHADVALKCIAAGVPLVTASYVSPQMKALHEEAAGRGVPILCEMGLDPGMDHMSAMKVIHEVQQEGSEVQGFSSICGGLPAPEAANNPLGYKFSWSPRGVLMALQNAATFLENGKIVDVTSDKLLEFARPTDLGLPAFSLEQLPNRNSLPYADLYGISSAHSVFRGTLRYQGFSKKVQEMKKIGLFDDSNTGLRGESNWGGLVHALGIDTLTPDSGLSADTRDCLEWLGLFDNSVPLEGNTVLDALCNRLEEKLAYGPQERDMALMQHRFDILRADGEKEVRTSTLLAYGKPGGTTAMASTVGLTAAVGAKLFLDGGSLNKRGGVYIPTAPEVYLPGLKLLEEEGYTFTEEVRPVR